MEFKRLIEEYKKSEPIKNKTSRQDHEWTVINSICRILDDLYTFENGRRDFRFSGDLDDLIKSLKANLYFIKGSTKGLRELEREGKGGGD